MLTPCPLPPLLRILPQCMKKIRTRWIMLFQCSTAYYLAPLHSHRTPCFPRQPQQLPHPSRCRPLNLDDGSADVHLARLKGWGLNFNFLPFPVAWEVLEHQGPEIYDEALIVHTIRVLLTCKEYGFDIQSLHGPPSIYLVPLTRGSGAPFWTLPLCGINPQNITATHVAILHSGYPTPYSPPPSKFPSPRPSSPSPSPAATLPQDASSTISTFKITSSHRGVRIYRRPDSSVRHWLGQRE
ncbi:hypothetical protein BDQ17DRAFT_161558 [Cyathus striatus]|nr:hypothetical protein BDQ17DRAFT_161558 [Cyathus striatus]